MRSFAVVRRGPLAATVAAGLLAAGCGGSSGDETTATADWANGLCSALTTWTSSVQSSANSLRGGNLSKNSLEIAADDIEGATNTLADDMRGLGKPDTQAGQDAKDSIDQLSDELDQGVEKIQDAVDDASGANATLSTVSTVTGALATMGTQISSTFDELQNLDSKGELEDAFNQADSCSTLRKSGS
jgi:methyl-accepting chemotaxis protein